MNPPITEALQFILVAKVQGAAEQLQLRINRSKLGFQRLEFFIALAAVRELTNMPLMNVELLKLGLRIRASRKILGLSQKVFSKECGVYRSYFGG